MIPSQLLKGTLEGCILGVIGQKETYGYEIAQTLEGYGFGRIADATISIRYYCGWKRADASRRFTGRRVRAPNASIIP